MATTPVLLAALLVTSFAVDIQTGRRNEVKAMFFNLLLPLRLLWESLRAGSEEKLTVATGRSQARGRQSEQRSTTSVGLEEVTMGTVLALSSPQFPVRALGSTGTVLAHRRPAAAVSETAWLTATIRPAGTFGRNDTSRLRALLDALSACASIVVLDLQAARLRSLGAGEVIEDAAWDLERRGGCLLCTNVDSESRACLSAAGDHAVLRDDASQLLAPKVTSGLRPEVRDGTYLGLVGGAPQTQLKALDTA